MHPKKIFKIILFRFLLPLLIILISTSLAVIGAEYVLSRFTRLGEYEQWKHKKEGSLKFTCYTSDPQNYYPYTIWDKELNQFVYCIMYDRERRKNGYFPEREKDVALIGDSFVFGQGVMDKDTLAYMLSQRYPEYNFRNFGWSGAFINQIHKRFVEVINENPEIKTVIYFYNINDMKIIAEMGERHRSILDFENIFWGSVKKKDRAKLPDFIKKSAVYHLLRKARILRHESNMTVKHYNERYFSEENASERETSINHLLDMHQLAQARDVEFYVVIYPLLYKDMWGNYPFKKIHQYLMDVCQEYGIKCIDGYPAFDKDYSLKRFTVHEVDYHPNGLSNRTIVDYLSQQPDFVLR